MKSISGVPDKRFSWKRVSPTTDAAQPVNVRRGSSTASDTGAKVMSVCLSRATQVWPSGPFPNVG